MSRTNARVRPAEPADIPLLVDLVAGTAGSPAVVEASEGSRADVDGLAERLTDIVKEGDRTILVAVDDAHGAVAGMVVAHFLDAGALDPMPVLQLSHLSVLPRLRRRGIGRMLLAAAVHLADEHGVDRVVAAATANSREANRYLARLGFAPLVLHRIAPTATLRCALGISDGPDRLAVLRRARLARRHRGGSRPGTAAEGA